MVTLPDGEIFEKVRDEILRIAHRYGIREGDVGYFEDPDGIGGIYNHKLRFDVYFSGEISLNDMLAEDIRLTEEQRKLIRDSRAKSYTK